MTISAMGVRFKNPVLIPKGLQYLINASLLAFLIISIFQISLENF